MRVVLSLLVAVFVCGCGNTRHGDESLPVKITIHKSMLELANAHLPDHEAVWHERGYKHDTVVDGRFVAWDQFISAEAGDRYADAYLHHFRVLSVSVGEFVDEELRFFRVMQFEKGAKDKRLMLTGDLRFWLETTKDGFVVRNIERIPSE